MSSEPLQWWGYKHINGSLQAKRYWGDPRDISEAKESDFVERVVGPFEAVDRADALSKVEQLT